jgi:hypothetical protein
MSVRFLAAAALVVALAAGCGGSARELSVDQVKSAFARYGLHLQGCVPHVLEGAIQNPQTCNVYGPGAPASMTLVEVYDSVKDADTSAHVDRRRLALSAPGAEVLVARNVLFLSKPWGRARSAMRSLR